MDEYQNFLKNLWNPETYDSLRRQLIPSFDLLYSSAVRAVAMSVPENAKILDLGAGTGLLSAAIRKDLPSAHLTLVDRSVSMLDQAVSRFSGDERMNIHVADLGDPLPEGPFDAVVSGLAIHHLTDDEKQRLFARIHVILSSGGLFVNVEQVSAPRPFLEVMYDLQHEKHVNESNTPENEWAAGKERMKYDLPIDVQTQLKWLRAAGFDTVDCLAKDWRFATYAGWLRT